MSVLNFHNKVKRFLIRPGLIQCPIVYACERPSSAVVIVNKRHEGGREEEGEEEGEEEEEEGNSLAQWQTWGPGQN